MTHFDMMKKVVVDRWISLFNPTPDALDLFHGDPMIPPPNLVGQRLRTIAKRIECWDGSEETFFSLSPETGQRLGQFNLHAYRAPAIVAPELKEAATIDFRRSGIPISLDRHEIVVGVGVTQLTTALFYRFAQEKMKILMPTPVYSAFWLSAGLVDCSMELLPATAETNYSINYELIRGGLEQHPDTKILFLVNPVNPTGEIFSKEELIALGRLLEQEYPDVLVVMDEIYHQMILEEHLEFTSFAALRVDGQHMFERTITIRGLSKCYGLAKLRIGTLSCCEKVMRELRLGEFLWLNTAAPGELDQLVAAAVLRDTPQEYHQKAALAYRQRRDIVIEYMAELNDKLNQHYGTDNHPYIETQKPAAGFFILISMPFLAGKQTPAGKPLQKDFDLSSYLIECGVAVLAASIFGIDEKDFVLRLTFSASEENLRKGLHLMEKAVLKLLD